jgi:O-succinylbenzoate synthase
MDEVRVWAIPMRTRFRGIDLREGVLLRGAAGWGEWSPFWDYDDTECVPWLAALTRLRRWAGRTRSARRSR